MSGEISGSSSGKREHGETTNTAQHLGRAPSFRLTAQGLQRNLQDSMIGTLTMTEKEGGVCNTSTQTLVDQIHTGSAQVVIQTSGFVHLQN